MNSFRPVRGLTIRQPWAWAILHAGKHVENRSWRPPSWLVGKRIALHAAKGLSRIEYEAARDGIDWANPTVLVPSFHDLARGAIVGTAVLARVIDHDDEYKSCRWYTGEVGMALADRRALREPIPWKGALGFWRLPDELAERVEQSHA